MRKGEYIYHNQLGTLKIIEIDEIVDGKPELLRAASPEFVYEISWNTSVIRKATLMEQVDFEVDVEGINSNWFNIAKEFPNIKTVINNLIYQIVQDFFTLNPDFKPTKFGATTNVFYTEIIFSIDDSDDQNLFDQPKWHFYDFAANSLTEEFLLLKPQIQELLYGEGKYKTMEGSNSHQIARDLMNLIVEGFIIVKSIDPRISNCQLAIINHDDVEQDVINRVKKWEYRLLQK